MVRLSALKIRSRLLLVLGFSVTALALVGGVAAYTIAAGADMAGRFIDTEFRAVQVLGGVRTGLGDVRRAEKDLMLHMGTKLIPSTSPSCGRKTSQRRWRRSGKPRP